MTQSPMHNFKLTFFLILAGLALISCSAQLSPEDIAGDYRGVLESPGGELAFPIHIQPGQTGDSLKAFIVNGADTSHFEEAYVKSDSLILGFRYYDSYLRAKVNYDGSFSGIWSRRAEGGMRSELPFRARKSDYLRYPPTSPESYPFEGTWKTTFNDEDGSFPAEGVFVSQPAGVLHGTFEKETGDNRFLEGVYTDSSFALSTFDGAHASLFKASLQEDGSLKGDYWSRDDYHATWTAEKGEGDLRSPLQIAADQAVGKPISFDFPDLNGDTLRSGDARFEDKPMVVYLFGSWCPNCADETRMLKELYTESYSDTDLQIIGLAYEFSGDFQRDAEMVSRYKNRFNIPWTLLVAGIGNKTEAASTLPFLDSVISFPTSIFVDRDHTIRAIHVGFKGPATGSAYYMEIQRFKDHIKQILNS